MSTRKFLRDIHGDCLRGNRLISGILLLSKKLDEYEHLLKIIDDSILIFAYDPSSDYIYELYHFIDINKIQLKSINNVGWIFHSSTDYPFTNDIINNFSNHNNNESLQELYYYDWKSIIDVIKIIKPYMKYDRFDLIACSLSVNPYFIEIKKILESETKLKFAYSDNDTGNADNADWILESHGINLIGLYFKLNSNEILTEDSSSIIIIRLGLISFLKKVGNTIVEKFEDLGEIIVSGWKDVIDEVEFKKWGKIIKNIGENKIKDWVLKLGKTVLKTLVKKIGVPALNAFKDFVTILQINQLDDKIKNTLKTIFEKAEVGIQKLSTDLENFKENLQEDFLESFRVFNDEFEQFELNFKNKFDSFKIEFKEGFILINNFTKLTWNNMITKSNRLVEKMRKVDWGKIGEYMHILAGVIAAGDPTGLSGLLLAIADLIVASKDFHEVSNNTYAVTFDERLMILIFTIINLVVSMGAVVINIFLPSVGTAVKTTATQVLNRIVFPIIASGISLGPAIAEYIKNPNKDNKAKLIGAGTSAGVVFTVSAATGKTTIYHN